MKKKRSRDTSGVSSRLIRKVRELRQQVDDQAKSRGSMNSRDTVEVDYFAMCDLITYFEETREAARRVVVARDALHQVFFCSGSNVDGR